MLTALEKAIAAALVAATAIAFSLPLIRRFRIIRAGRPRPPIKEIGRRTEQALAKVFLQKCTLKNERLFTGLMHAFIFYGALVFDTMTVNHILEGFLDGFHLFGKTSFSLFFSFAVDLFAVLVLLGVIFFVVRRFYVKPQAYATTPRDSALIYAFLILVTLSYLYFEMSALAFHPETTRLSFLGRFLAGRVMDVRALATVHLHFRVSWWLHSLLVFAFIAYVPHSKYLHMIAGPLNVLLRDRGPTGRLEPIDLERSDTFGITKATDFSWKDYLDAFACMECGRCQDACPAWASQKPLSPKMILFNLEKHLLDNDQKIINKKSDSLEPLVPGTFSEGEIWTCTTCGSCRHVCPVEIEHVSKIIGLRRAQVLMEGRFPPELSAFFRNLETNSNPWGFGFSKREEWMQGLNLPRLKDNPKAEILFWVGCMGSFDPEGIRTARAMAEIMIRAGLDVAVLGAEEKCCGDSARRLGQEYLFQTLARQNLHLFRAYGVRKIVTFCPHGYNVFKNEYPKMAELLPGASDREKKALQDIQILFHAELIRTLIVEGKIQVKAAPGLPYTIHDPCYLGRHNGIFDAPREVLCKTLGGRLVELKNSREHSFCCGAGGGLMWTEESPGKRVSHLRTEEIIRSGMGLAASCCPFCLTMLKDGLKDKGRTDIQIKDIARIVAENLVLRPDS